MRAWPFGRIAIQSTTLAEMGGSLVAVELASYSSYVSRPRAKWQSGHAAACKAVYAGSIPTLASNTSVWRRTGLSCHAPFNLAIVASVDTRLLQMIYRLGQCLRAHEA